MPITRPDLLAYTKFAQYTPGYVCGQLELTSRCMQRCPMCASWRPEADHGEMDMPAVEWIFQDLNAMPTFEHLSLTGGDPQCFPDLHEIAHMERNFRLQLTTAMPLKPEQWYCNFDRVRISFDAVRPSTHLAMRGVSREYPAEVLEWMVGIDTEVSTLTTVNEFNVYEVPDILHCLEKYAAINKRFRRAIFLLEIRDPMPDSVAAPFDIYAKLINQSKTAVSTSFAESPTWAAETRKSFAMSGCRCAVGDVSFHIKCNGDVYPCCLIGGEAIPTVRDMKLGNIHLRDFPLAEFQKRHRKLTAMYYRERPECRKVCQWKQVMFNKMVMEAQHVKIAIP